MAGRSLDRILWEIMPWFVLSPCALTYCRLCRNDPGSTRSCLFVDMGVPDDGQGLAGVVTSGSYKLEEKRRRRDEKRCVVDGVKKDD